MIHVLDNIIRYHGPVNGLSSTNISSIKCSGHLRISIGDIVLIPDYYEQGIVTSICYNYNNYTITTALEVHITGTANDTLITYNRNLQDQFNYAQLMADPQTAIGSALDEHARMFYLSRYYGLDTGMGITRMETDAELRCRILDAMGTANLLPPISCIITPEELGVLDVPLIIKQYEESHK